MDEAVLDEHGETGEGEAAGETIMPMEISDSVQPSKQGAAPTPQQKRGGEEENAQIGREESKGEGKQRVEPRVTQTSPISDNSHGGGAASSNHLPNDAQENVQNQQSKRI